MSVHMMIEGAHGGFTTRLRAHMDLLELTDAIKKLFNVDGVQRLGDALKDCVLNDDVPKFDAFVQLVDGDLSQDWLQKVYQYYLADRKEKKQDYTPKCLAELLAAFTDGDDCVDLCAGSGALTIQAWVLNPNRKFELYEADDAVVPFLLFNLAVRNIDATVYVGDALLGEVCESFAVKKRGKYGLVSRL